MRYFLNATSEFAGNGWSTMAMTGGRTKMKPGFINTGMTIDGVRQPVGYTARFDHSESWGYFWQRQIYEITIDDRNPLAFVDEFGFWWMTDRHYFTDFGSIPPPLQNIPGLDRERHRFPFLFHDSAYQERGLWRSPDCGENWRFIEMARVEADAFLSKTIRYDIIPGGTINRGSIFWGVRLGGLGHYGRGDLRTNPAK
jgi:hypothetical protein